MGSSMQTNAHVRIKKHLSSTVFKNYRIYVHKHSHTYCQKSTNIPYVYTDTCNIGTRKSSLNGSRAYEPPVNPYPPTQKELLLHQSKNCADKSKRIFHDCFILRRRWLKALVIPTDMFLSLMLTVASCKFFFYILISIGIDWYVLLIQLCLGLK